MRLARVRLHIKDREQRGSARIHPSKGNEVKTRRGCLATRRRYNAGIAVNIAKLASVPRQILKDIPRPPNSASRDD
jgi:hypothetical protein